MFRRRLTGVLAAGVATAALLAACGGGGDDAADGPVTLKVLTWEPGGTEYWQQVKSTFEASHQDIKLELQSVPFDKYPEVQGPYITSQSGPDVMANNAGLELFDRRGRTRRWATRQPRSTRIWSPTAAPARSSTPASPATACPSPTRATSSTTTRTC